MKKNLFSDNNRKKNSKGFYTALGLSAVMIGSACYFAYDQGKGLNKQPSPDKTISVPESPVNGRSTGVPKTTAPAVVTAPPKPRTTTVYSVVTEPPKSVVTIPASEIIVAQPQANDVSPADADAPPVQVSAEKLENAKPPLADASNVIEPFSNSELVKSATTGSWQTHNGADIAAEVGAEVYSVSSGEVTDVTNDPLWGVSVTVNHHNGFISRYCGLGSELSVQKGDTVAPGQVLGAVGQTADVESALPPHLHIELKHNGAFVDPVSFFPG